MADNHLLEKFTELDKQHAIAVTESRHFREEFRAAIKEQAKRSDRLEAAYKETMKEVGLLKAFQARILGVSLALSLVWSYFADKIKL